VSDRFDIRQDLEPGAPEELVTLAERLLDQRPLPNPVFRGELRRALAAQSERTRPPERVRALIARFAAAGAALLIVGAVSAAGAGPLG